MRRMANYLPEDWIEEVRLANDIVEVINEYLPLKPSGKGFLGFAHSIVKKRLHFM